MSLYTQYGFDAAEAFLDLLQPATGAVVNVPAAVVAPAVTPAAPAAAPQILVEPGPDHESGQGGLGLGDALVLRDQTGPRVAGAITYREVEQGYLGNCPLPAVLAAMAHTPAGRTRLDAMISVQAATPPVASQRQRVASEYPVGYKGPLRLESFTSGRTFEVRFRQGKTLRVTVTPQLYVRTDLVPPSLHYATSRNGALWPSIIEKAYAVSMGDPPNRYNYQDINNDLVTERVFSDLCGKAVTEGIAELKTSRLTTILKDHATRPTVAGSQQSLPNASPVIASHDYAVVGFDEKKGLVTLFDANAGGPAGAEIQLNLDDFRKYFHEVIQAEVEAFK